jgi:hypothetical protein
LGRGLFLRDHNFWVGSVETSWTWFWFTSSDTLSRIRRWRSNSRSLLSQGQNGGQPGSVCYSHDPRSPRASWSSRPKLQDLQHPWPEVDFLIERRHGALYQPSSPELAHGFSGKTHPQGGHHRSCHPTPWPSSDGEGGAKTWFIKVK